MEKIAERIKEIIDKSGNIVVLSGLNVMRETGLNGVRAEHLAYETEEKYGYANEEIISSAFYARRSEIFYDYIKNVTINKETAEPTVVHKAIRQLQQKERCLVLLHTRCMGFMRMQGARMYWIFMDLFRKINVPHVVKFLI